MKLLRFLREFNGGIKSNVGRLPDISQSEAVKNAGHLTPYRNHEWCVRWKDIAHIDIHSQQISECIFVFDAIESAQNRSAG